MEIRLGITKTVFVVLFFVNSIFFVVHPGALQAEQRNNGEHKVVARAQFAEKAYNFGTVSEGALLSHTFELKNVGNANLGIQRIVSGCGCTVVSASSDSIAPGQASNITVNFNTVGFSGSKTKEIRVYSNDFDKPEITLSVSAKIESEVELAPATLIFEELVHGSESSSKEVSINVKADSGKKITGLKSYSKYLKIEQLPALSKNPGYNNYRYKISLDSAVPIGELRDRILVSVSKANEISALSLPVIGRVSGSILVEPPQVSFGIVEGTKILERSVTLKNRAALPIEIISLSSDTDSVEASFETLEFGKNFLIKIKLDPKKVNSDLRALVEIKTSNPQEPSMYLSIFGVIPPKLDY